MGKDRALRAAPWKPLQGPLWRGLGVDCPLEDRRGGEKGRGGEERREGRGGEEGERRREKGREREGREGLLQKLHNAHRSH